MPRSEIFGKIGRVSLHFAAQPKGWIPTNSLKAELQLAFAVADSRPHAALFAAQLAAAFACLLDAHGRLHVMVAVRREHPAAKILARR